MTHTFTIDMTPVGKSRHRHTRDGRTYTPQKTIIAERTVAAAARAAGVRMIDGPVRLDVEARFAPPKSLSKAARIARLGAYHTQVPDMSNIIKTIEDALKGIAYRDDSAVCTGSQNKRWADKDAITVTVGSAS